MPAQACGKYPLLESVLAQKGLTLRGIYSNHDAAEIFGVSVRTIQDWVREGKLFARILPGRGRFLSEDLEAFLNGSARDAGGGKNEETSFLRAR